MRTLLCAPTQGPGTQQLPKGDEFGSHRHVITGCRLTSSGSYWSSQAWRWMWTPSSQKWRMSGVGVEMRWTRQHPSQKKLKMKLSSSTHPCLRPSHMKPQRPPTPRSLEHCINPLPHHPWPPPALTHPQEVGTHLIPTLRTRVWGPTPARGLPPYWIWGPPAASQQLPRQLLAPPHILASRMLSQRLCPPRPAQLPWQLPAGASALLALRRRRGDRGAAGSWKGTVRVLPNLKLTVQLQEQLLTAVLSPLPMNPVSLSRHCQIPRMLITNGSLRYPSLRLMILQPMATSSAASPRAQYLDPEAGDDLLEPGHLGSSLPTAVMPC